MNKSFSYRLRNLRRIHSISGEKLALHLGVRKSSVSNWENSVNYPNQETLNRIADYFNVSVDYLLGRTDSTSIKGENVKEQSSFQFAMYENEGSLTEEQKELLTNLAKELAKKKKINK